MARTKPPAEKPSSDALNKEKKNHLLKRRPST